MISVLIPWRTDNGHRERLFEFTQRLWADLPVEVVVGYDFETELPFNVSRAFNDAASRATGDVFVLYGADHLPDVEAVTWAAQQCESYPWCPVFAGTGAYGEADTELILAGADPAGIGFERFNPMCIAIMAVRRDAWDFVHGMDERFYGWGSEDRALRVALECFWPAPSIRPGALACLWHPEASRDRAEANYEIFTEYLALAGDPAGMRGYLDNLTRTPVRPTPA